MVTDGWRQGELTAASTPTLPFPPEAYSTKKCHVCSVPTQGPGAYIHRPATSNCGSHQGRKHLLQESQQKGGSSWHLCSRLVLTPPPRGWGVLRTLGRKAQWQNPAEPALRPPLLPLLSWGPSRSPRSSGPNCPVLPCFFKTILPTGAEGTQQSYPIPYLLLCLLERKQPWILKLPSVSQALGVSEDCLCGVSLNAGMEQGTASGPVTGGTLCASAETILELS